MLAERVREKEEQTEANRPIAARIYDGRLRVELQDGRVIETPLEWYSWLVEASSEEQTNIEFWDFSIFWPDLDDGLSIEGMLAGRH